MTSSLPMKCSTTELQRRVWILMRLEETSRRTKFREWAELDLNQRTGTRADLQSAAFNHSAIDPRHSRFTILTWVAPNTKLFGNYFLIVANKPPQASSNRSIT
jgi:hypothetical protein